MVDCITVDINAMSITCIHNPLDIPGGGGGGGTLSLKRKKNKKGVSSYMHVI